MNKIEPTIDIINGQQKITHFHKIYLLIILVAEMCHFKCAWSNTII